MLYIDNIIGKGLSWLIIIELILTNLAYMVVMAVPMSVLVSSLMAYGGFAESNEFTVLKSAGINPVHALSPMLLIGVLLFGTLFWFSDSILPEANYKAKSLFLDIRMKKPGFDLKENVFYDGIDGFTFLVKEIPAGSDSLYEVTLFQDKRKGRDQAIIKAHRGILQSESDGATITLNLFDGQIIRFIQNDKNDELLEKLIFEQYRISFDVSDLAFSRSNPNTRSRNDRTMNMEMLKGVVDSLQAGINTETTRYGQRNPLFVFSVDDESKFLSNKDSLTLPNYLFNVDKITKRKTVEPPVKSQYIALNSLSNQYIQARIVRMATRSLRTIVINYDGLITNIKWKEERQAKYMVEWHKKMSIPFGCIIFIMIGAPLGLLTKKGNLGIAAVISAIIFTFYWISLVQGEKLADRLFISPFIGMWASNIFLFLLGILLTVKIIKDHLFHRS